MPYMITEFVELAQHGLIEVLLLTADAPSASEAIAIHRLDTVCICEYFCGWLHPATGPPLSSVRSLFFETERNMLRA
jgi:hypothetical protein